MGEQEKYVLIPTFTRLEHHDRKPVASSRVALPSSPEHFDVSWWKWLVSEVTERQKKVTTRHGEMRLVVARDWRRPHAYLILTAHADTDKLATVAGSFYAIEIGAEETGSARLEVLMECFYPDLVEPVYDRILAFLFEQWPGAVLVEDYRASGEALPNPRVGRTEFELAEWQRKAEAHYAARMREAK
jgi:hypothetical protein